MARLTSIPSLGVLLILCATVGSATPIPAPGQAPEAEVPPEALERHLSRLRELQADFERFRERHTPVTPEREDATCDEQIGRICIWFGGEDEGEPVELAETRRARVELIRELSDAFEELPSAWTIGQLVHYLVESQNVQEAERVARGCGIEAVWWCHALTGYALHARTEYTDAEAAFREALGTMPEEERRAWTSPRFIMTDDGRDAFDALDDPEREARFELYWTLSDPLFLFEGNDRLTDHFARWVEAYNRRDAFDPLGQEWGDDLEATLVRYGRNTGYGRTHAPQRMMSNGFADTRRMVGFHHPKSRGYLFPERFLESPSDIGPETWITAPREARTWYAPPYAPEVRGLETQVGRFRRDGQMLVVGAYRPTIPDGDDEGPSVAAWSDEGGVTGPPAAGLFLVPLDGRTPLRVQGREAEGVLTMKVRPGAYVSSLEVVDIQGRQAWRARQGVSLPPLEPGMVGVSDLMILRPDAPLPDSLEDAIPHVRPGVRLEPGERFGVVWEVYGLRIQEPVRVTLGFSGGRPGFLERVGDFLGILEPDEPVEVTFDDVGPDRLQEAFRSVRLTLPDLEPGEYTLHLRLELAGRTPVVKSRPIVVG